MSASREKHIVIFCLLLGAVTLAFYNPIIRNQFVDFDDQAYILKNSHIQHGLTWDTVKWSFTTFYYGNWHPLTWLSHAVDCEYFGLNPAGHHYANLLLHVANALLLFLLLQRATRFTWFSLFVAALFALHPVNVESVAWAAERKNVLSTLFFLLALHAYDRYGRGGGRYLYGWVAILFALGLMAKPQIVTLPFVLLLWDYWPLERMRIGPVAVDATASELAPATSRLISVRALVWEKFPLFLMAAADCIVTVIAQRAGNTIRTLSEASLPVRIQNVFVSYVRYIGKAFWPSPLVPLYPRPESTLPDWQVIGAMSLLFLVSALVFYCRDRRYLLVGWFWFLGTLVPMIGIVTVGDQAMADRYAYVAFIGLFIALVWAVGDMTSSRRSSGAWLAVAAVVVLFVLGSLTYRQLGYWHDNESLWRYTLSVTERNYVAHNNLALELRKQGRSDEAIHEFREGMALHRYPPMQILALALYELEVKRPEEAIEECNTAMSASSEIAIRETAFSELGQAHLQLGHYDQAAENFQKALHINSEDGMALMGSGVLALRQGQYDIAIAQLMHAARVDASDMNILLLEQALRRGGRDHDADSLAAQLQKVSPNVIPAKAAAGEILSFAGLKPL
jgi:protein O-mannosyl-transferase